MNRSIVHVYLDVSHYKYILAALICTTGITFAQAFPTKGRPVTGNAILQSLDVKRNVCRMRVYIQDPDKLLPDAYGIGIELEKSLFAYNDQAGGPMSFDQSTVNKPALDCYLSYSFVIDLKKFDNKFLYQFTEILSPLKQSTLKVDETNRTVKLQGMTILYSTNAYGAAELDALNLQDQLIDSIKAIFGASFVR
jgi:hypothetical protein